MMAVAVVGAALATMGVLIGGLMLKWRSDHFRARASHFAELEKSCTDSAISFERLSNELAEKPDTLLDLVFSLGMGINRGRSTRSALLAERNRHDAERYGKLKREFLRAADRPWEPGPPDPIPEGVPMDE